MFNKVIETFKNLWNRIKDFFKIAWTKIQVNYYNITKDIFNLRKYVYGLRDKSSIVVKKEDFEQFAKELGFFFIPDDVDGLETKQRVKEFINITQPENIESVFKLISNTIELYSKNTNKDIIIQDYKDKLNTLLTSFNKDVKNKILPNYESLLFKKLGINFIYYHELGHLLTGQHETIIPNNKIENSHIDKNKKFIFEGFRIYLYSLKENRADAYACLKTGMSPKKVAEMI